MQSGEVRPEARADALQAAQAAMQTAPRLIPIYLHRYLPATPCLSGNPVLSVWNADIIHYGFDLADYFIREFQTYPSSEKLQTQKQSLPIIPPSEATALSPRPIQFWDAVMGECG